MTENDEQTGVTAISMAYPPFEGRHVHATAMKITGAMPMDDLEGVVVSIDDVITMACQFKVINVHHTTDAKGNLTRLQVLRPVIMAVAPMDPSDPDDDGIIRALPEIVEKRVEPVCTCHSEGTDHDRDCMLVRLLGMTSTLAEGEKLYLGFTPPAAAGPAAITAGQAGEDETDA